MAYHLLCGLINYEAERHNQEHRGGENEQPLFTEEQTNVAHLCNLGENELNNLNHTVENVFLRTTTQVPGSLNAVYIYIY